MSVLKNALEENVQTFGAWMQIPSPIIAEILASSPLFDWICIDLEHGAIDIEKVAELCRVIKMYKKTPIVRIPILDQIWITRSLDAGAQGIIVPRVNSVDMAKAAIKFAMYPPDGIRGIGYCHANMHGNEFDEDEIACFNGNLIMVMQIEHIQGLKNLREICKVSHIDALFLGPLDLKMSMDKKSKPFDDLITYYNEVCQAEDMPYGIHIVDTTNDSISKAIGDGNSMMALGTDCSLLVDGIVKSDNITGIFCGVKGSRKYK